MKEKVLLGRSVETGKNRVFESTRSAAADLGISHVAVSRAVRSGGVCCGMRFRYVPRIYVVKVDGMYKVVVKDGAGWVEPGGRRVVGPIGRGVVDITEQMWCMARDL